MVSILFKWLFVSSMLFSFVNKTDKHPIFVSVTEIEHNLKNKTLEVSCKIFTDDFEKTLRAAYKTHVDLQDDKIKPAMDKLVNDYVQKHLKINVDGKAVILKYLGFEKIEEGTYSYYEAANITAVQKITVVDDILFEYNSQQMNLLHITVGGNRKSTKLSNPERTASIDF